MKIDYSVEEPLNREPKVGLLVQSYLSLDDQYDRNHGPIPHLDAEKHTVIVDGLVSKPLELSMNQLQQNYAQHEIVSALQCAGNRRHTMRTLLKEVSGIDWGDAAVMNCTWKGPRLRDVLNSAGVASEDLKDSHVAFSCFTVPVQGADWYGGSIEFWRAMKEEADVLLALEMNGEPLTANRGHPIRVIVPGVSGCRSVKWLDAITIQSMESTNLYQRYDYKILPPEATDKEAASKFWAKTPALQDMPINSVVAEPQAGSTVKLSSAGTIHTNGYALPQGDQGPVVKVEVSIDDGQSWVEAELVDEAHGENKWSWALWKADVHISKGVDKCIFSRATDAGGNVQSDRAGKWNLRGVAYNGYGESRNLFVN